MIDDTLAAELAAITKRARIAYNDYDAPPRADFDCLVAAVEASLKEHERKEAIRLIPCDEHKRWAGPLVGDNDNLAVRQACPACQVLDDSYCTQCVKRDGSGQYADWPCPTVEAITTALTGEDAPQ